MTIEQRQHARFKVRLAVSYPNAAGFVADYVENLSIGGLFIAGAQQLELLQETLVKIDLPNHGSWTVGARVVFIFDKEAAERVGRPQGAGLQITRKPRGFDDALFGYLIRLGRRREVAVMVGDVPGKTEITDAGYQIVPLVESDALTRALDQAPVPILGVVVPTSMFDVYDARARIAGAGKIVFSVTRSEDITEVLAQIDGLL